MSIKTLLTSCVKALSEVMNAICDAPSHIQSFVRGSALENQPRLDAMKRPTHSMLFPHIKRVDAWVQPQLTPDEEAFSNFIQKEFEKCKLRHYSAQFPQDEILRKYWQDNYGLIYRRFVQEQ